MQNNITNIKCREVNLSNANENWYIIPYDLFSRVWYIATCGPFCKDATHMSLAGLECMTTGSVAKRLIISRHTGRYYY